MRSEVRLFFKNLNKGMIMQKSNNEQEDIVQNQNPSKILYKQLE